MERIHGGRVDAATARTPERAASSRATLFSAYIRQVTVKGLYHADPHRRQRAADTRRPARAARLRADRPAGRRHARVAGAAAARDRAEPRRRRRRPDRLALAHDDASRTKPGFVHELRRKLPRYQWRPLAGIKTGEGLADLQRLSLQHGIALPTSFALVGKTLSQAESIARTLDPTLDPVQMIRGEGLDGDGAGGRAAPRAEPAARVRVHAAAAAAPAAAPRRAGRAEARDRDR